MKALILALITLMSVSGRAETAHRKCLKRFIAANFATMNIDQVAHEALRHCDNGIPFDDAPMTKVETPEIERHRAECGSDEAPAECGTVGNAPREGTVS